MRKPDLPILPTSARSSDVIRAINTLSRWAARLDTVLLSRKDAVSVGDLTDSGSHSLNNGAITSTALNSAGIQGGQSLFFDTDPEAETGYVTSTSDVKKGKWFLNEEKTIVVDEKNERFGVGKDAPEGTLHVSGMIPGVIIEQTDTDESFIKFVGTATAATLTKNMVAAADVSAKTIAGYVQGYLQDEGNQIADGKYYIPVYTLGAGNDGVDMLGTPDLTVEVNFSSATWNTVGTHELFTVTGICHCKLLMYCTESLLGGGNLQVGHALDTDLFQVSTAQVDFDIGELVNVVGVPTETCAAVLDGFTANGAIREFIVYDTDIGLEITVLPATSGKIVFCLWWSAITAGATITVGVGGPL